MTATRNRSQLVTALVTACVAFVMLGCASTPTRESTGEYLDDSAITAKIKAAYATDPDVAATQVHIVTYRHVVQLSGFVDTDLARTKAEQLAQLKAPDCRIINNIVVKGSAPPH